ncbi:transketolase [Helicobacter sp. 16-1353]|uniref:transketolase n=1 Tax=Helicobacter sp. 16-1353 TaxID=2004996 RepID=UPI000DCCF75E|nr:transketolase [Helicobacter sp. 16-1353]RAX53067.1 transketolase [Helicobacter sp. 16-1353]
MNIETKMSNTLRFLSVDMVESASSGHPGAAMGLADILTILSKHLIHNPKEPKWINRDRLVFSGGHCSALVYSFLHLCGYSLSLDDLKHFRQLDSKTPGHPEYGLTSGIEITTGPLGQGIANAVGFAMASKYARNLLGSDLINHRVYCFCGDGDLQEGISYEACSLAGLHNLDNLIIIYDSNNITIEGNTDISFNEDIKMRFEAQGFEVLQIDGHNFEEIDTALIKAKESPKPFLIIAKTKIAKGALELEGSHKSHGAPLGSDLVKRAKKEVGIDGDFFIPKDVKIAFESCIEVGDMHYKIWKNNLNNSPKKDILDELLNPNVDNISYPIFDKPTATRSSNGKILNAICANLKGFVGGSADLSPSNNTYLQDSLDFPNGANLHFGIREHAMGAITNAFAAYGLFIPFCATFFVFSDYMSPSIRIASISHLKVFYIFTHDSIGVGEDGATHQPIEQLSHFRAMPNLLVFRPADANENVECWKIALRAESPCAFVLSRQNLPILDSIGKCEKGAYILKDSTNPKIILCASGSEVHLALDCARELDKQDIPTKVISVPCYDLLLKQDKRFLETLFNPNVKILAIEAGRAIEWYRFADEVVSMDSFGKSGKGDLLFKHFGFSVENIVNIAKNLL